MPASKSSTQTTAASNTMSHNEQGSLCLTENMFAMYPPHSSTLKKPLSVPETYYTITSRLKEDLGVYGDAWTAKFDFVKLATKLTEFHIATFKDFDKAIKYYADKYNKKEVFITGPYCPTTPPPAPPTSPINLTKETPAWATILNKGSPTQPIHIASTTPTPIIPCKKMQSNRTCNAAASTNPSTVPGAYVSKSLATIPEGVKPITEGTVSIPSSPDEVPADNLTALIQPSAVVIDTDSKTSPSYSKGPAILFRDLGGALPLASASTPTDVFGHVKAIPSLSAHQTPKQSADALIEDSRAESLEDWARAIPSATPTRSGGQNASVTIYERSSKKIKIPTELTSIKLAKKCKTAATVTGSWYRAASMPTEASTWDGRDSNSDDMYEDD